MAMPWSIPIFALSPFFVICMSFFGMWAGFPQNATHGLVPSAKKESDSEIFRLSAFFVPDDRPIYRQFA
jgi:hypothetical protein